jgi:hypothetical protein
MRPGVVGAGLDADVVAAPGRLEAVATERGQIASAGGRWARSPNRPSKRDGPSPMVTVSREAGRPYASPVSARGDSGSPPTGPTGSPLHIRAAASDQARSSAASSARDPATSKLASGGAPAAGW